MSAFNVSASHQSALVNAWISLGSVAPSFGVRRCGESIVLRADDHESWQRMWSLLAAENATSVASRYNEDIVPVAGKHRSGPALSPVAVLKALACYEYQSCEHAGWTDSIPAQFVRDLRSAYTRRLPGWDAAEWSIS